MTNNNADSRKAGKDRNMKKTIKLSGNFVHVDRLDVMDIMDAYTWETIVHYMDDDIREAVHLAMSPCMQEDFLIEYMRRHMSEYGMPFGIN